MTISVEELIVLLIVLRTGKPLIAAAKQRVLTAIDHFQPPKEIKRRPSTRLRARVVEISIDLPN
jgi:hypothetical protein